MHKKLDALKAEVMRSVMLAEVNGLPPLGVLTATLAAVEEQVAAIYQGVMLAEIVAPTDGERLREYHAIVAELLETTHERVMTLHELARTKAEQGPVHKTQREIEQLESMFADAKRMRKPS